MASNVETTRHIFLSTMTCGSVTETANLASPLVAWTRPHLLLIETSAPIHMSSAVVLVFDHPVAIILSVVLTTTIRSVNWKIMPSTRIKTASKSATIVLITTTFTSRKAFSMIWIMIALGIIWLVVVMVLGSPRLLKTTNLFFLDLLLCRVFQVATARLSFDGRSNFIFRLLLTSFNNLRLILTRKF